MTNLLADLLLIEEPSVFRLYRKMIEVTTYFLPVAFTISIILEFLGELKFGEVIKRLLISMLFLSFFYNFHTFSADLALKTSNQIFKEVSPRSVFMKKWYHPKVATTKQKSWGFIKSFFIPDLNDLLGTLFFLLAKLLLWVLKLIYSTVYHLTYVFTGIFSILYFFGWTKDALKGAVQSTLWCMILPFVVVAILTLVGNSLDDRAREGIMAIGDMDTILWLFGVTLLLLISPAIAYGMVKGEGIHGTGAAVGKMAINAGMHIGRTIPVVATNLKQFSRRGSNIIKNVGGHIQKMAQGHNQSSGNNFNRLREAVAGKKPIVIGSKETMTNFKEQGLKMNSQNSSSNRPLQDISKVNQKNIPENSNGNVQSNTWGNIKDSTFGNTRREGMNQHQKTDNYSERQSNQSFKNINEKKNSLKENIYQKATEKRGSRDGLRSVSGKIRKGKPFIENRNSL